MMRDSDIAVIGMSCRFPGARSYREYWANLKAGIESIHFFSKAELATHGVSQSIFDDPNYVRASSYIECADRFDEAFFRLSPREAALMDPQHRIFLHVAWEAIEDSGYVCSSYPGAIGVFAGTSISNHLLKKIVEDGSILKGRSFQESIRNLQLLIGNDKDYLCSRLSYLLNLKGPSINVQTACSTSLVAVHLACQSILCGDSDMALAGGVSLHLTRNRGYYYEEGLILSRDGHCRPFDACASGTIFGEGAGALLLKRLENAIEDQDPIHAIIRGSAVNNDGASKLGYTAPSIEGQVQVIREAQHIAEVTADSVGYVEAHGTGTVLGDPIEFEALNTVFEETRTNFGTSYLGSVKSNIGHLDTAAGVAGLIKVILSLKYGLIPPTLHFSKINPNIDLARSSFSINRELQGWKKRLGVRRAGITSLGIGGTNCHIVVEEASVGAVKDCRIGLSHIVCISAKDELGVARLADCYLRYLAEEFHTCRIEEFAYTTRTGRSHFRYRFAFAANSIQALRNRLKDVVLFLESSDNASLFDFASKTAEGESMEIKDSIQRYCRGESVKWDEGENFGFRRIHIPPYPFQGRRYPL